MTDATRQRIKTMLLTSRVNSDGLIAVLITPNEVLFSCDRRVTIPDLHGLLQGEIDNICAHVANERKQENVTR